MHEINDYSIKLYHDLHLNTSCCCVRIHIDVETDRQVPMRGTVCGDDEGNGRKARG